MKRESRQLARLAACDAELHRKRQQRTEVVQRLEQKRNAIAVVKVRRSPPRPASRRAATPLLVERAIGEEDAGRYAALVQDFEADVQLSAPLLIQLAEQTHDLESRRSNCLNALSTRIRAAYEARVAVGRLPAIVPLEARSCGGCGRDLRSELEEQGDEGTGALICPACQRLLYVLPETLSARS